MRIIQEHLSAFGGKVPPNEALDYVIKPVQVVVVVVVGGFAH